MTATIIIVLVVIVLGGAIVLLYNNLVRSRNKVDNAWAQVDFRIVPPALDRWLALAAALQK